MLIKYSIDSGLFLLYDTHSYIKFIFVTKGDYLNVDDSRTGKRGSTG